MAIDSEHQKHPSPNHHPATPNHHPPGPRNPFPQTGAAFIAKRPKHHYSPTPHPAPSLQHSPAPFATPAARPIPAAPRHAPPSAPSHPQTALRAPVANPLILYAVFRAYVFGALAKRASVAIGQKMTLRRDRSNASDARSVKAVALPAGPDIGHVDVMARDVLADVLEDRRFGLRTEGVVCDFDEEVEDPPQGQFVAMARVSLIGPLFSVSSFAAVFNDEIQKHQTDLHFYKCHQLFAVKTLDMIEEEKYGMLFDRTARLRRPASDGPEFSFEELRGDFGKVFCGQTVKEDLRPAEASELLRTELMLHQKIGLRWMIGKEQSRRDQSLFWKKVEPANAKEFWQNELTGEKVDKTPEEFKGGILADEMGLGKTIQTIALIATSDFGAGPTLIVCPVSVMNTWKYQLDEHMESGAFKTIIYHGSARNTAKSYLEDFDVVITSYSVVTFEFTVFGPDRFLPPKGKKGLASDASSESDNEDETFEFTKGIHSVPWFRVVLDEAHKIRSKKSKKHKAMCALTTERRWCLTGTPVQNRLDDLHALIKFLKVQPLVSPRFWRSLILDPLKLQNPEGLRRLWTLREYILMRRTKKTKIDGKPIVNLPKKIFQDILLDFSKEDADNYKILSNVGERSIRKAEKSFGRSNAFIFAVLTRLRQFCCHPQLVPEGYARQMALEANLPPSYSSVGEAFEDMLDGETVCSICNNIAEDPSVASCFHVFCKDCRMDNLENERCPICGKDVEYTKLADRQAAAGPERRANSHLAQVRALLRAGAIKSCSKINRLLEEIRTPFDTSGRKDKSVIFSQWVTMLDIIEHFLNNANIMSSRIDGMKTPQARDLAYHSFQSNDAVDVILISLSAGGEGINLTAGNKVFLIDPWWNPAAEDQAIDRVHRLGQTRDVQVTRLYMKDSIESNVKNLQQKKRQLMESTMSNEKSLIDHRLLLSEIRNLFK